MSRLLASAVRGGSFQRGSLAAVIVLLVVISIVASLHGYAEIRYFLDEPPEELLVPHWSKSVEGVGAYSVSVDPEGDLVAVGFGVSGEDVEGWVSVYEVDTGNIVWERSGLNGIVTSLAWSPDGELLAVVVNFGESWGGLVVLTREGSVAWSVNGLGVYVGRVAWSPDGEMLAVPVVNFPEESSGEGSLLVYDREGNLVWSREVSGSPKGVAWSPDGETASVGVSWIDDEGGIHGKVLFLSRDGEELGSTEDLGILISSVSWSPDGEMIAVTGTPKAVVVLHSDGSEAWRRQGSEGSILDAAWGFDGETLAVGGSDGVVTVYSVKGSKVWESDGLGGTIFDLDWGFMGLRLAAAVVGDDAGGIHVFRHSLSVLRVVAPVDGTEIKFEYQDFYGYTYEVKTFTTKNGGLLLYAPPGYYTVKYRIPEPADFVGPSTALKGELNFRLEESVYYEVRIPGYEDLLGKLLVKLPPDVGARYITVRWEDYYYVYWETRGPIEPGGTLVFNAAPGEYIVKYGLVEPENLLGPDNSLEGKVTVKVKVGEEAVVELPSYDDVLARLRITSSEDNVTLYIDTPYYAHDARLRMNEGDTVELYIVPGEYTIRYYYVEPDNYVGVGKGLRGSFTFEAEAGELVVFRVPSYEEALVTLVIKAPEGASIEVWSNYIKGYRIESTGEPVELMVDPDSYLVKVTYNGVEVSRSFEAGPGDKIVLEFSVEDFSADGEGEEPVETATETQATTTTTPGGGEPETETTVAPGTTTTITVALTTERETQEAANGTTIAVSSSEDEGTTTSVAPETSVGSSEGDGAAGSGDPEEGEGPLIVLAALQEALQDPRGRWALLALAGVTVALLVAARVRRGGTPQAGEEPALPTLHEEDTFTTAMQAYRYDTILAEPREAPREAGHGDEDQADGKALEGVEILLGMPVPGLVGAAGKECKGPELRTVMPGSIAPVGPRGEKYDGEWRCCRLGCGGWGCAYRCQRPHGGEPVVFKIPRGLEAMVESGVAPTLAGDLVRRITREAEAVANLRHPHLLRLLAYSRTAPLLVYEYADGGSLEDWLRRGWRPSPGEALLIAIQLGDALRYIHSTGLVHGDVKPGNVFVKRGVVKLGDFSNLVDLAVGAGGIPREFTPGWQAPEQLDESLAERARERRLENRVDVYQLGSLILYLLTGETTGDGKTLERALSLISDPELRRLLREMLAEEPWRRPSIEEVLKRLYVIYKRVRLGGAGLA